MSLEKDLEEMEREETIDIPLISKNIEEKLSNETKIKSEIVQFVKHAKKARSLANSTFRELHYPKDNLNQMIETYEKELSSVIETEIIKKYYPHKYMEEISFKNLPALLSKTMRKKSKITTYKKHRESVDIAIKAMILKYSTYLAIDSERNPMIQACGKIADKSPNEYDVKQELNNYRKLPTELNYIKAVLFAINDAVFFRKTIRVSSIKTKATSNQREPTDKEWSEADRYHWLGRTFHSNGNHASAITYFDRGIAACPQYPANYIFKGMSLGVLGKNYEAISLFKSFQKKFPNLAEDVEGQIRLCKKDIEEGIK